MVGYHPDLSYPQGFLVILRSFTATLYSKNPVPSKMMPPPHSESNSRTCILLGTGPMEILHRARVPALARRPTTRQRRSPKPLPLSMGPGASKVQGNDWGEEVLLLMEEILYQLIKVCIFQVQDFFHQQYEKSWGKRGKLVALSLWIIVADPLFKGRESVTRVS